MHILAVFPAPDKCKETLLPTLGTRTGREEAGRLGIADTEPAAPPEGHGWLLGGQ